MSLLFTVVVDDDAMVEHEYMMIDDLMNTINNNVRVEYISNKKRSDRYSFIYIYGKRDG